MARGIPFAATNTNICRFQCDLDSSGATFMFAEGHEFYYALAGNMAEKARQAATNETRRSFLVLATLWFELGDKLETEKIVRGIGPANDVTDAIFSN